MPRSGSSESSNHESSACGVGLVARRDGRRTNAILLDALQALDHLEHRGGCAADGVSGDGAGLLTDIPFEVLGIEPGSVAVASLFLRDDAEVRYKALEIFRSSFEFFGLDVLRLRDVPIDPSVLGEEARATQPKMLHAVLRRPEHCCTRSSYAALLYRAKQEVRRRHKAAGLHRAFFFASLSADTIVYKALTRSRDLPRYYLDLQDERFRTRFALFHRRFSTNTRSTWDKAQPFRVLCHNGEINTIRGNRTWTRSREIDLGLPREDLLTRSEISDSGSFNEMAEALAHRSSISRTEDILALMMPPADNGSAYYRFWSRAVEPWDGPALIAYADGDSVGARLDRNGFRPCRWAETADCFYLASEAGVYDIPDGELIAKGSLGAGSAVRLDLETGDLHFRDPSESRTNVAAGFEPRLTPLHSDLVTPDAEPAAVDRLAENLFGVTREELSRVLIPMCDNGKESIGSMGDTARIAVLSEQNRSLFDFFYQHFAQVTNPPLDYLRERLVTDLRMHLGRKPNIFSPRELLPLSPAYELESPILSLGAIAALYRQCVDAPPEQPIHAEPIELRFERSAGATGLAERLQTIAAEALAAHDRGISLLILSDRSADFDNPPVPSLLALRAVVRALNRAGCRLDTSLVVECGDARSVHSVSALVGFGATAVCPYLALTYGASRGSEARMIQALEEGLLKTMSKVGISVASSYQSSKLYSAIGLGPDLIRLYFQGLTSPVGGLELVDIGARVLAASAEPGTGPRPSAHLWREQTKGLAGEQHTMTTARSRLLHGGKIDADKYSKFAAARHDGPLTLRDLIDMRPAASALPIDEVADASHVLERFVSGGMSFGAISAEAQRDIFIAMARVGGRSCSGEGGENPFYFVDGTRASIKQIASGRFGVTAEYLATAGEYEIKIAQGAKPGEGGQLMGKKVNADIAKARHATIGTDLISPPPLHDIYSIEDLAGLIHELKEFQPSAQVGVKLVSNANIGTIAVGVAKAGADVVAVSGGDGGTGAAPLTSMKHAGLPWEIGLAEVHRALAENGLRDRIEVRVDGGLSTGRDIIAAAALGADSFGFGKLLLIAQGCIMARVCERNTCPSGIATQDPKFRARYSGSPDAIVGLLESIAEDVRRRLATMGFKSLAELRGRVDRLTTSERHAAVIEQRHLSLATILQPAATSPVTVAHADSTDQASALNEQILDACVPALAGRRVELDLPIRSTDRAIPARLSHALASRTHQLRMQAPGDSTDLALAEGSITLRFTGSAGQGFGVFLSSGMELRLVGEANDSVGKSMSGGSIAIRPPAGVGYEPAANAILGNSALYGATGGSLYANGRAGDRFAVRNSGATAVIEGVGMHGCEYMTAGSVAILGAAGANLGAGMTGGELFVRRAMAGQLNREYVVARDLGSDQLRQLTEMLRTHAEWTGSRTAARLLADSPGLVREFVVCVPVGVVVEDPGKDAVKDTVKDTVERVAKLGA